MREPAVELSIPGDVRSEPHRHAHRDHLDDAAEGVAGRFRGVYPRHHLPLGFGVQATDWALIRTLIQGSGERRMVLRDYAPELRYVGADFDLELAEQLLADRTAGDARNGLARAGALQDIPGIGAIILE